MADSSLREIHFDHIEQAGIDYDSLMDLNTLHAHVDERLSNTEVCYPATQNTVYRLDSGETFDLLRYCGIQEAVSFKKPAFAGTTTRFKAPAIQVFGGGSHMVMGASSFERTLCGIHRLRLMLRYQGLNPKIKSLLLTNRVCNANVGHPINIENFKVDDTTCVVNQLANFPAILYITKPTEEFPSPMTMLIFSTGNVNVMGLRTLTDKEAHAIFNHILPVLKWNRVDNVGTSQQVDKRMNRLRTMLRNPPEHLSGLLSDPVVNSKKISAVILDVLDKPPTGARKRKRAH